MKIHKDRPLLLKITIISKGEKRKSKYICIMNVHVMCTHGRDGIVYIHVVVVHLDVAKKVKNDNDIYTECYLYRW